MTADRKGFIIRFMTNSELLPGYVTVDEFAQRSGFTSRAVEKWIQANKIQSEYNTRLNRRLIPISELERVQKHGSPGDKRRAENKSS